MNEERQPLTEEELLEQLKKIKVSDVLLQTVVTLVNLGGQRIAGEQRDLEQAKLAIDAIRALLPLCPEDEVKPVKDALSQLQMMWARESQAPAPEEADRAKAREKIWTPPGTET